MRILTSRKFDIYFGALLLSSLLFWALRIFYWTTHIEDPFSDLFGYVRMADNIVQHFFFGPELTRNVAYYTPVTPIAIAIAKLISADHFIGVFRVMIQLIAFLGLLALAREIIILTGRRWLGVALLFIVAISRPSIFWSLKLATETVCEALLYVTFALALATLRTRSIPLALVCGIACLALGLNRPNFIPGVLLVPLAFLTAGFFARRPDDAPGARWRPRWDRRALALAAVFALGFFGTWSVWIGRNLNHGLFVPTSGSGYISMIWDFGAGPVAIGRYQSLTLADGTQFDQLATGRIVTLAEQMPTDRERGAFLQSISRAWFAANWMDMPTVFLLRLKHYVAVRGASGLTQVSREELFPAITPGYNNPYAPTGWLNLILLDKTPTVCFLGLIGLIILVWRAPRWSPVFIGLALVPWLAGALVIGYERTVESLIGLTLWFALYGLAEIVTSLQSRPDSRYIPNT